MYIYLQSILYLYIEYVEGNHVNYTNNLKGTILFLIILYQNHFIMKNGLYICQLHCFSIIRFIITFRRLKKKGGTKPKLNRKRRNRKR